MAYDASASYEPPRRAYYSSAQQAPKQNGYRNYAQEQYNDYYVQQPFDDELEEFDQSYGQPNGYRAQDLRSGRQGDPRYLQQTSNPGGPVTSQHATYEQTPQPQSSRPNPRDARAYGGESYANGASFAAQNVGLPAPPSLGDAGRPQSASHSDRKQSDPGRTTMEEWKAKEKAKLHAAGMRPDTLPQDNAFPVFPTNRDRSKTRESDSSKASAEPARPGTSSGNRHERKSSKTFAYGGSNTPENQRQPNSDHKSNSAEQVVDRPVYSWGSASELQLQPQQRSRYQLTNPDIPVQQSSPPKQIHEDPRSVPTQGRWGQSTSQSHANGSSNRYDNQLENASQDRLYPSQSPAELSTQARTPPPPSVTAPPPYQLPPQPASQSQSFANQELRPLPQPRQAPQRGPPPLAIDTNQPPQSATFAYRDHQPISPGQVPPRPSTSHGQQRSPLAKTMTSPASALPQTQTFQYHTGHAVTERPKQSVYEHGQQNSLDDIYGHYQDRRAAPQVGAPPRTRDQEIEAEMPDFDSGAPGGTSLLHKRSKQSKGPNGYAPPSLPVQPPQHVNSNAYGYSGSEQLQHGQRTGQMSAPPSQRRPPERQGSATQEYPNGFPQPVNLREHGASYNQQPPQQMCYDRPPQPPFVNEQPRRSLDEARRMPYHPAPAAAQRLQTSNQSGSMRQQPPQQRRGNDRNVADLSVQTSWGGLPSLERIGSAPPMQQTFQVPESRGNGMQVTRQLSDPQQPVPQQRRSDPDSLPHHPVPVRPGHMAGAGQPSKPPPIRQYDHGPPPSSHQRQPSIPTNASMRPVTAAELDQLRSAVEANPNDQKRTLLLIKKLVEASDVLASDGGRADARAQAKNRERFIMEADKRLRKLVAAGNADAQFYLADCYGQGEIGLPVNLKEAFTLYQAAAKAGHGQAAYRTAMCCELGPEDGGTSKDYGKAVQWYRRGAALGDPDAMFKIGIILLKGLLGQQRNIGEAVNFLKRAAEQSGQNNPHALYELAQLYESTQTNPEVRNKVVADDKYAFDLFQQAASAGHKSAQFRLGQAHEYGQLGAAIDNRSSITWYTKAAAQGEHQAELALSGWYLTGSKGILEQSDTEAYLWARKAAASEPPLAKAMFAMGYFTETGIGCPKNMDEAKRWYARAAAYRFPKAQERLEELKRSGGKGFKAVNGKLSRKDQKKDEENCVLM